MAHGHGSHLDSIGMIYGCNSKVKTEFSETLRSNYTYLFSKPKNSYDLAKGIEKLINSNEVLKASCRKA